MKTLEEQKELLKTIPTKLLIDQLWNDENHVLVYPIPIEYIAGIINKPSEDVKKYSFEIQDYFNNDCKEDQFYDWISELSFSSDEYGLEELFD
jgi:hypothetical protein